MMKTLRFLPVFLILFLFCGCSSQLEQEYSLIVPHEEQYEVDLYSDALTAENYLGLKNAILNFVETREDYGVVRIYSYEGDLTTDLANAVYELTNNDPLVAYAVDYMTYDYSHIVSYYELYFYITFRVDIKDIDSIIYCSDISDVEAALEDSLVQKKYNSVIRIPNFQDFNLDETMHRLFISHPELAISEPTYIHTFYPESGAQRILDLWLLYPYDTFNMISRSQTLDSVANEILETVSYARTDRTKIERIYLWMSEHTTYMHEKSQLFTSAYNTLCNGYGNSEGFSLSVQLLCNKMDIPCFTVEGELNGEPWFWNIIYINNQWCHFDCAKNLSEKRTKWQQLFDEDMIDYVWETDIYPTCPTPLKDESDNQGDMPVETGDSIPLSSAKDANTAKSSDEEP